MPARFTLTALIIAVLATALPARAQEEPEIYPLVFPVAGDNYYSDTFGAPRSGGRTHAGTDIIADKMVPVVAAASGTVGWIDNEQGGDCCAMALNHDDGWASWYIHLNNDTPGTDDGLGYGFADGIDSGVYVEAGQLIGWVGDSGNAEATVSHLHFELHDPSGTAINPYSHLQAATEVSTPPSPEPDPSRPFSDIGASVHETNILQLAELGITGGCAPGLYCPEDPVTRAQMATFLVRALDLPAIEADSFDDDNGTTHEANIEALAAAQVTLGCGERAYCPNDPVTRAQMATFLIRALDSNLLSRPNGRLVPADGVLVGATVSGDFSGYEAALGRSMDIAHESFGPDDVLDPASAGDHTDAGRVPMITWTPGTVTEALTGDLAAEISAAAAGLAALDTPVFLRYWPELDAEASAPDDVAVIWADAQAAFEVAGATNVIWVWSPAVADIAASPEVIDWVAIRAYGDSCLGGDRADFAAAVGESVDTVSGLGDYPVMVAEWGAAAVDGQPDAQADFIDSIATVLDTDPRVAALVATEAIGECDWRVAESAPALDALTALVTSLTVDLAALLAAQ